MRFKGGILPYTLAVSLVVALFCFSVILLVYYRNIIWLEYKLQQRLAFNVESAIEYALNSDLMRNEYDKQVVLDLYGEGDDSVSLVKNHWGVLDRLNVMAFSRKHKLERSVLIGSKGSSIDFAALYVANDCPLPVTMIGYSSIVGDAYLPIGGIKGGFLDKQEFKGGGGLCRDGSFVAG